MNQWADNMDLPPRRVMPDGSVQLVDAVYINSLERSLAEANERAIERLVEWRAGGDPPCRACGGLGVRAYGSTATWRGGIGGQAITSGVCDVCWGSGSAGRPWPSWRAAEAEVAALKAQVATLQQYKALAALGRRIANATMPSARLDYLDEWAEQYDALIAAQEQEAQP